MDQAIRWTSIPLFVQNCRRYQNLVQEKNEIHDYQEIYLYYQIYNKEIDSRFTYRDIKDMLLDIYTKKRNAFKVNLGFGFILYRSINRSGNITIPATIISFLRKGLQLTIEWISKDLWDKLYHSMSR